ncbi:MAG: DNA-directed RNA polymerase subunit omega [Terriglobales bacterium]
MLWLGRVVAIWRNDKDWQPEIFREGEQPKMRSDRVFEALHTLRNRYMLCQLASKATRKFHKPNTRIQETMNEVFDKIADAERHDILSEPENFAEAQRRAA